MMNEQNKQRPWYRQNYVWFIILWPLTAIVAGVYTFYLAYTTDDGLVVDDYYKRGKGINQILERDKKAEALGLSATVAINPENKQLMLTLGSKSSSFSFPEAIQLNFLHPTQDRRDQHLTLAHQSNGIYSGIYNPLIDGRWYVYLETSDWRLNTSIKIPNNLSFQL